MKYECSATHCLPIPLMEIAALSPSERPLARAFNRLQRRTLSPAAASPTSKAAAGQLKKFDQFWEGTSSITVGPDEVGRLFVSSSTTSNPGSGPSTIDTWVEDWVITDWAAFSGAPSITVSFASSAGVVDDYILGQPAGADVRRMILTFQYQDALPAAAPPSMHSNRQVFVVENTQTTGGLGYLYRESGPAGFSRLELWVLQPGYVFPSQPGEGTRLKPLLSTTGALATAASPADFIAAIKNLNMPLAYYVETAGVFVSA